MAINLQTTKKEKVIGLLYPTQQNPYKIIAHIERATVFMNKKNTIMP